MRSMSLLFVCAVLIGVAAALYPPRKAIHWAKDKLRLGAFPPTRVVLRGIDSVLEKGATWCLKVCFKLTDKNRGY